MIKSGEHIRSSMVFARGVRIENVAVLGAICVTSKDDPAFRNVVGVAGSVIKERWQ